MISRTNTFAEGINELNLTFRSNVLYIINYYPYQTQENYYFFFTMNLAKFDWPSTLIDLDLYVPLFLPF